MFYLHVLIHKIFLEKLHLALTAHVSGIAVPLGVIKHAAVYTLDSDDLIETFKIVTGGGK